MKMMKNLKARLLSLSLAFVMMVSLFAGMTPVEVRAAETINVSDIEVGDRLYVGDTVVKDSESDLVEVRYCKYGERVEVYNWNGEASYVIEADPLLGTIDVAFSANGWKVFDIFEDSDDGYHVIQLCADDEAGIYEQLTEPEVSVAKNAEGDYVLSIQKESGYNYCYMFVPLGVEIEEGVILTYEMAEETAAMMLEETFSGETTLYDVYEKEPSGEVYTEAVNLGDTGVFIQVIKYSKDGNRWLQAGATALVAGEPSGDPNPPAESTLIAGYLSSWVTIVGNQLVITPTDDSVEYYIGYADVPITWYNNVKLTPIGSEEYEFNSIWSGYVDEYSESVYRGKTTRTIWEGEGLYIATFIRRDSASYYPMTGVHAFECVSTSPAIIAQPTSSNPTYNVEHGDLATYQWYEGAGTELKVTDSASDTTIQANTRWSYTGERWNVDPDSGLEITLKKGDVFNVNIVGVPTEGYGVLRAEILCENEIQKGGFDTETSICFVAPKDGTYRMNLWTVGNDELFPDITATVTRKTPVEGQTTNTLTTNVPGDYVCMATWGSYGLVSDVVTVIPGPGAVEKNPEEVVDGTDVDSASLKNNAEDLMNNANSTVFTADEKTAIANGADAKVWLKISPTTSTSMSNDEAGEIDKRAKEVLGNNVVVKCFEADLLKKIGNGNETNITETGVEIEITIALDDSLINTNSAVTRNYEIIRSHETAGGNFTVEKLNGTVFDAANKTLTFKTNKFSTYAIAYTDTAVTAPGGGNTNSGNAAGSSSSSSPIMFIPYATASETPVQQPVKDDVPKTGEGVDYTVMVWTVMLAAGVAGLMLERQKKRQ